MKDIFISSLVYLKAGLLALKYQKLLGEDFETNFDITRELCQKVLEIAEIEVESFGMNNIHEKDALMIASNHNNFMDALVILANSSRPISFVAKSEAFSYPFAKHFLTAIDCISLNRKEMDAKKIMATQEKIANYLRNDRSLLIFPEGGTVKTDDIGEFKAASLRAPKQVDSYILPTYIEGTNYIFKNGSKFLLNSGMKKVILMYGNPFKPSELGLKMTRDIALYTRNQVLELKMNK